MLIAAGIEGHPQGWPSPFVITVQAPYTAIVDK